MNRTLCISLVAAASAIGVFASQPIATVSSSASFELDGSLVNTAGVTSWPLMPGDRVVAKDSPIVIAMRDGSRITLAANSQMRFESATTDLTANLTSGSMQFTLASGSNLRIVRGGSPVSGRSGLVSPPLTARPELLRAPPPPPTPISSR
jgi:hypothetical protein